MQTNAKDGTNVALWRHRLCRCLHFSVSFATWYTWLGFTTSCRHQRNLRSLARCTPSRGFQNLGWSSCLRSPTFRHADHFVIRVSLDISTSFRCLWSWLVLLSFAAIDCALLSQVSNAMTALRRSFFLVHRRWLHSAIVLSSLTHSTFGS